MRNLIAVTFVLLGLHAGAPAQDLAAQMRRLALIEEQEGDLRAAEAGYRELLGAEKEPNARGTVALRLGSLLGRLGRLQEAAAVLEVASAASEDLARQAAAVLQDPQQDEQKKRVNELIDQFCMVGGAKPISQIQWLGQAMVPEVLRRLKELHDQDRWITANGPERLAANEQFLDKYPIEFARAHGLSQLPWRLGGDEAAAFVQGVARGNELGWQRWIAAGVRSKANEPLQWQVNENMQSALDALMSVDDPEGMVQRLGIAEYWKRPLQDLVPFLQHRVAAVRLGALGAVQSGFHAQKTRGESFDGPGFTALATIWSALLRDPDADVCLKAWSFIASLEHPEAGELYLKSLPFARAPVRSPASLPLLATEPLVNAICEHRRLLDSTWGGVELLTGRADLTCAMALRLVEAGFMAPKFLQFAWQQAESEAELVAALAAASTPELASCINSRWDQNRHRQGGQLPLPAACVPELTRILALFKPDDRRVQGPLYVAGSTPASELLPSVLRFHAGVMKPSTNWVLVRLARVLDSRDLRVALREILSAPETTAMHRNSALGRLAARGDIDAVPSIVQMLAAELPCESGPDDEGQGLNWLGGARRRDNPEVPVHGYSPEQLLAFWRVLLEPRTRLQAMREAGFHGAPPELVVLWMETMREYCQKPELESGLHGVLERLSARIDDSDQPTSVRIRELASEILCTPHRLLVVGSLSAAGLRGLRPTLIDLFAKGELSAGFRDIIHGIDVPAATLAQLIRRDKLTHWWYQSGSQMVPASDEVTEAIRVVLSGKEGHVDECRRIACEWLGANLRRETVPDLLLAAREPALRQSASHALETIRDYHAQQAYWTTDRIDTRPQAAAARLLAQAKPEATKEQRLLAIRSLGALGAPEALPHLIDWLTTTDTELQTAIRGAIAQIHDKAGLKAEPPPERGR